MSSAATVFGMRHFPGLASAHLSFTPVLWLSLRCLCTASGSFFFPPLLVGFTSFDISARIASLLSSNEYFLRSGLFSCAAVSAEQPCETLLAKCTIKIDQGVCVLVGTKHKKYISYDARGAWSISPNSKHCGFV